MTKVVKLFGKHNLRPRENCHKIIWSRSDNSKKQGYKSIYQLFTQNLTR